MTINNRMVALTQLVCAAGVFYAPTLYISLLFFILCAVNTFNYEEE